MVDESGGPRARRATASGLTVERQWVTKSDVRQHWICPYAFWLVDSGAVDLNEILAARAASVDRERIIVGELFERDVLDGMPGVSPEEAGARFLYGVSTFEHPGLMIRGRPDGIELATLAPIEVKSHAEPTLLDRLELAFYWLLLGANRAGSSSEPYGWLLPRVDSCAADLVHIALRPKDFAEVEDLIAGVRRTRERGAMPRYCRCLVCRTRPEVRKVASSRRDVMLLSGVGRRHGETLDRLEVKTIDQLLDLDPAALALRMREIRRTSVSVKNVASWQHHAMAFMKRKPVRFVEETFLSTSYIVVDLEYDAYIAGSIWLVGALARIDGRDRTLQHWCDTPAQLRRGLEKLEALLCAHPGVPIVTFSGLKADIPQLRAASRQLKVGLMRTLHRRHLDLYLHLMRSLRFPISSHGLKELGAFIRRDRRTTVSDGLEAAALYERYRRTKSMRVRASTKRRLLAYNIDDMRAVADLVDYLRRVPLSPQAVIAHAYVQQLSSATQLANVNRAVPRHRHIAATAFAVEAPPIEPKRANTSEFVDDLGPNRPDVMSGPDFATEPEPANRERINL